jgi:hypothetical protein
MAPNFTGSFSDVVPHPKPPTSNPRIISAVAKKHILLFISLPLPYFNLDTGMRQLNPFFLGCDHYLLSLALNNRIILITDCLLDY